MYGRDGLVLVVCTECIDEKAGCDESSALVVYTTDATPISN